MKSSQSGSWKISKRKHPLPPGEYKVLYNNETHNDYFKIDLGTYKLGMGDHRVFDMGAVVFNVDEALEKEADIDYLVLAEAGSGKIAVKVGGARFDPKAILPGVYDLLVHYDHIKEPGTIAKNIVVKAGEQTVVTLNTGFKIKMDSGEQITKWALVPLATDAVVDKAEGDEGGVAADQNAGALPIMSERSRWRTHIVMPGKYKLMVNMKGMKEALPIAPELVIESGKTIEFDTGM